MTDTLNKEVKRNMDFINEAMTKNDIVSLLGHAAMSLYRLANAQEALVELAKADLETQITGEIESRAETLAEEIAADKSKRSFIGKK